jgi:biotin carboxyl carrier protein
MEDYLIRVNEKETLVNKKEVALLDIAKIGSSNFHLLHNNKAYKVSLLETDYSNKTLKIAVNGNTYDLKIEDEYDQQVKKMGLLAVTSQKVNSIMAPMPGLIIDVLVEEGQEISEGTPLLVLSAMKMENIILSQGAGIIKSIAIKKEDAVEKGQLVIEME